MGERLATVAVDVTHSFRSSDLDLPGAALLPNLGPLGSSVFRPNLSPAAESQGSRQSSSFWSTEMMNLSVETRFLRLAPKYPVIDLRHLASFRFPSKFV